MAAYLDWGAFRRGATGMNWPPAPLHLPASHACAPLDPRHTTKKLRKWPRCIYVAEEKFKSHLEVRGGKCRDSILTYQLKKIAP